MSESKTNNRSSKSARRSPKRRADSFVGNFKNPITARFGASVRVKRESLGMTQEELAYEAGIDRAYLSELERGKVGISLERANALATALHCRLSDLLKGD
ncbi:MAG: hypothetical protein B6D41_14350 [Chloroflexi bacterium UTCFX4]|nr:MAG: hypothetical protein B6D41_14350 [Chloroflexi bacterium UTCFX4]